MERMGDSSHAWHGPHQSQILASVASPHLRIASLSALSWPPGSAIPLVPQALVSPREAQKQEAGRSVELVQIRNLPT